MVYNMEQESRRDFPNTDDDETEIVHVEYEEVKPNDLQRRRYIGKHFFHIVIFILIRSISLYLRTQKNTIEFLIHIFFQLHSIHSLESHKQTHVFFTKCLLVLLFSTHTTHTIIQNEKRLNRALVY